MATQYHDRLEKIEQDDCAEVYTFTSLNATLRYTSHSTDVVIGANTFTKAAIQRSEVETDSMLGDGKITIQGSLAAVFSQFKLSAALYSTAIEIKRYYLKDFTVYGLIFTGHISNISMSGGVCAVECRSKACVLLNNVPRLFWQLHCNNRLFDDTCGVLAATYAQNVTVSEISNMNNQSFIKGDFVFPPGDSEYFKGGKIFSGNEWRYITDCGNAWGGVTIHYPFFNLSVGDIIIAYPGCDKTWQTCLSRFSNLVNFVGMPYIPSRDVSTYGVGIL